jgi:hypothetical protein
VDDQRDFKNGKKEPCPPSLPPTRGTEREREREREREEIVL